MINDTFENICKTGSSVTSVYSNGIIVEKNITRLSIDEVNAIFKGIDLLKKHLPDTLLMPNNIEYNKDNDSKIMSVKYIQKYLKPWIDKDWIPGELLYELAITILEQQDILLKNGFCLVDARPENYWLAKKPHILIDIGSIKPLTKQNIESFRTDFINNFIYPLLLEKNLCLPVSSYFKGNLQNHQINPFTLIGTWSSISLIRELIWREFIDLISNLISSSSPEFIEYLNSIKNIEEKKPNLNKFIRKYNRIINRVRVKAEKRSNWNKYLSFHGKAYTNSKIKNIDIFLDELDSSSHVVDLGSNLTTAKDPRIEVMIDNDITICRALQKSSLTNQIVLLINISEAMTKDNIKDFKALNCGGYIDSAIVMGLIHHIVIDNGLCIEAFFRSLSELYKNVLLEYPSKEDPMVQLLLKKKNENISWGWENLHMNICTKYFKITKIKVLNETRVIYFLKRNEY